jgi:hypothetical protein
LQLVLIITCPRLGYWRSMMALSNMPQNLIP